MNAYEMKDSIANMAGSLKGNFNAHNASLLNAMCAKLFALTGEVYSNGRFVKAN